MLDREGRAANILSAFKTGFASIYPGAPSGAPFQSQATCRALLSLRSSLEMGAFALGVARAEGECSSKLAIYASRVAILIRGRWCLTGASGPQGL